MVRSALCGQSPQPETGLALRKGREAKAESESVMKLQTEDFVSSLLGLVLCAANVSFVLLLLS
jgi:hypothetical protein